MGNLYQEDGVCFSSLTASDRLRFYDPLPLAVWIEGSPTFAPSPLTCFSPLSPLYRTHARFLSRGRPRPQRRERLGRLGMCRVLHILDLNHLAQMQMF